MQAYDPTDQLDASLTDFEAQHSPPPSFGFDSQLTVETESDMDEPTETVSGGGFSPPAWRVLGDGNRSSGFWHKGGENLLGYARPSPSPISFSREPSLGYEDEAVLATAVRTRLPTGSLSPEKERSPEPEYKPPQSDIKIEEESAEELKATLAALPSKETPDNYIRFAVRAEVLQRTEPLENTINFVRSRFHTMTKSWTSTILSLIVALLSITVLNSLFQPANQRPVPDLVKVAGIARSFEPLIYFSENGATQVGDLQATGVAVWDLGESVRSSNMTSAPIIVKELDDLSDSLKTLSIELTKFFANVDGDIDGILIVMDWARRELAQIQHLPSAPLTAAFDNIHNLLSTAGVLETPTGEPTRLGALASFLFGASNPQRTRATLQRTFNEFLSVLEEAIRTELDHSLGLFALFEAIDRQFLNLARTVVRESSNQETQHADLLSSLWTRILGPKASEVRKYERNRDLLRNVREKTVRNKGILVEHNQRLQTLGANLGTLRRKLVSPLVRSANSSHLSVDEQIRGLEDVGSYLEAVRTRQKGKLMEMLYGSGGANGAARNRMIDQTGR